jgi:hypothetical protein
MLDTLVRHTRELQDRRTSLAALGVGLLAAAAPGTTAGKSSCGKKVKKKCKQLAASCEDVVRSVCTDECLQAFIPCCQELANCDGGGVATCFLALSSAVCCE